jgi:hypothetical protein
MAYTTIQLRRDTAANWASVNPVLAQGEAGYETDTNNLKFGDGSTAWSSLSYYTGNAGQLVIDSNASHIQPVGNTQVAGSVGLAADAGHQHVFIADTWHTITLDSSWQTLSGHPAPAYRMLPGNMIQLTGFAEYTSTMAATGSAALNNSNPISGSFNGVSYQPVSTHYYRGGDTHRLAASLGTNGVVTLYNTSGASLAANAGQAELEGIVPLT